MSFEKIIVDSSGEFELVRCSRTGIAVVRNHKTGERHSAHPNIAATGSVTGMKKLGYWRPDAQTKRTHGTIYNISVCAIQDKLDELAAKYCRCGGTHATP